MFGVSTHVIVSLQVQEDVPDLVCIIVVVSCAVSLAMVCVGFAFFYGGSMFPCSGGHDLHTSLHSFLSI